MQKHEPSAPSFHLELGQFVRGLAHDIANPLNALAMNAELTKVLLDRGDKVAARESLQRLLADCARCGRLVQTFQRFGAALEASPPEPVNIGALLQSSIASMQSEMPDTGMEFRIDGATDTSVHVDPSAMECALAAVLRNAAEAGANTVDIMVESKRGRVCLRIADNGSGIEARWRERVTEPFFSTRRAQGGSGLGLTLACEIVQRHGGSLEIRSEGVGTTVCIDLPTASGA